MPNGYASRRSKKRAPRAQAIQDGDAEKAEELMRDHMVEYANFVKRRHPALMNEVVGWR